MKPLPKPTKADRPKLVKSLQVEKSPAKPKGHTHGICPSCGTIFKGKQAEHEPGCSLELPPIIVRKRQTDRQLYNMALDALCRVITIWRDGCNCVLQETDGAKCWGDSQWGHVIPQGSSSHLKHNLSNSARQCAGHNQEHRWVQVLYYQWYQNTFGKLAFTMLGQEWRNHPQSDFSIPDLKEKLLELSAMYEGRFQFSTATMQEKVYAGYYGDIIREAWIKEGKI